MLWMNAQAQSIAPCQATANVMRSVNPKAYVGEGTSLPRDRVGNAHSHGAYGFVHIVSKSPQDSPGQTARESLLKNKLIDCSRSSPGAVLFIIQFGQARPYYKLHGRVCFKRRVMEGFYNSRTALCNPEDFFSCFGYSGPKLIRGGCGFILRR